MRQVALVVALMISAVGGGMLWFYKQQFEQRVGGGEKIDVLVATADLNLGDRLEENKLTLRALPEAYFENRHIRANQLESVVGVRVRARVSAGESLLWSDLAISGTNAQDLSGLVLPGMRAVAIPAGQAVTFDGLLRSGDRVDTLLTIQDKATKRAATYPLLQNLIVLATGRHIGDGFAEERERRTDATVTLAAKPDEARILTSAMSEGKITLVLRHPDDVRVVEHPSTPVRPQLGELREEQP